jgi:NDP-sugar pyrophosphorylase family protein
MGRKKGIMKAIILVAGSGKRMLPLTRTTHKTLLEVKGRAVIERIIDPLLANGVTDITLVTGYLAEEMRAHLSAAYPDLSLTYQPPR